MALDGNGCRTNKDSDNRAVRDARQAKMSLLEWRGSTVIAVTAKKGEETTYPVLIGQRTPMPFVD